jgi:predicted dehydrogenase
MRHGKESIVAKLGVGVIGPGLIWDLAHRREVERLSDRFELVAFSGRSNASEEKVRTDYPGARFYRDYRELIADADVEGVIILTPIPLNAPAATEVLKAGKIAFLEKPLGANVREARELCDLEDAQDGRIYVLEQAPYGGVWDELAGVINSGRLGRVVGYETTRHVRLEQQGPENRGFGDTDWRIHPAYPLGMLFDGGVHELAVQSRLFGTPSHVHAVARSYREGYGDYDHVAMFLEYPDGPFGVFCHSGLLGGDRDFFTLRGTEGLAHYSSREFRVELHDGRSWDLPRPDVSDHAAMWDHLADCVADRREAFYTSRNALREIETLAAVEQAVREGRRVDVDRASASA